MLWAGCRLLPGSLRHTLPILLLASEAHVSYAMAPDTVACSAGFMEANSLTTSQELAELELGGGSPPDAKSVKPAGGHACLHCRS